MRRWPYLSFLAEGGPTSPPLACPFRVYPSTLSFHPPSPLHPKISHLYFYLPWQATFFFPVHPISKYGLLNHHHDCYSLSPCVLCCSSLPKEVPPGPCNALLFLNHQEKKKNPKSWRERVHTIIKIILILIVNSKI